MTLDVHDEVCWRAALLRGVSAGPGGPQALVSLSAEQFLRVPVAGAAAVWERLIGRRVWVDVQRWQVAADRPGAGEQRHS